MGGMPDAGSTRSAPLSSMLAEDEGDPLRCMGWEAVAAPSFVVCCGCGWLGQVGAEAGAPDRVPPIPENGDLSLGL